MLVVMEILIIWIYWSLQVWVCCFYTRQEGWGSWRGWEAYPWYLHPVPALGHSGVQSAIAPHSQNPF